MNIPGLTGKCRCASIAIMTGLRANLRYRSSKTSRLSRAAAIFCKVPTVTFACLNVSRSDTTCWVVRGLRPV